MTIDSLNAFRLGGGTALALQMGHRKSVDFDLFTKSYPLDKTVFEELNALFSHAEIRFSEFHITMYLLDNKGG